MWIAILLLIRSTFAITLDPNQPLGVALNTLEGYPILVDHSTSIQTHQLPAFSWDYAASFHPWDTPSGLANAAARWPTVLNPQRVVQNQVKITWSTSDPLVRVQSREALVVTHHFQVGDPVLYCSGTWTWSGTSDVATVPTFVPPACADGSCNLAPMHVCCDLSCATTVGSGGGTQWCRSPYWAQTPDGGVTCTMLPPNPVNVSDCGISNPFSYFRWHGCADRSYALDPNPDTYAAFVQRHYGSGYEEDPTFGGGLKLEHAKYTTWRAAETRDFMLMYICDSTPCDLTPPVLNAFGPSRSRAVNVSTFYTNPHGSTVLGLNSTHLTVYSGLSPCYYSDSFCRFTERVPLNYTPMSVVPWRGLTITCGNTCRRLRYNYQAVDTTQQEEITAAQEASTVVFLIMAIALITYPTYRLSNFLKLGPRLSKGVSLAREKQKLLVAHFLLIVTIVLLGLFLPTHYLVLLYLALSWTLNWSAPRLLGLRADSALASYLFFVEHVSATPDSLINTVHFVVGLDELLGGSWAWRLFIAYLLLQLLYFRGASATLVIRHGFRHLLAGTTPRSSRAFWTSAITLSAVAGLLGARGVRADAIHTTRNGTAGCLCSFKLASYQHHVECCGKTIRLARIYGDGTCQVDGVFQYGGGRLVSYLSNSVDYFEGFTTFKLDGLYSSCGGVTPLHRCPGLSKFVGGAFGTFPGGGPGFKINCSTELRIDFDARDRGGAKLRTGPGGLQVHYQTNRHDFTAFVGADQNVYSLTDHVPMSSGAFGFNHDPMFGLLATIYGEVRLPEVALGTLFAEQCADPPSKSPGLSDWILTNPEAPAFMLSPRSVGYGGGAPPNWTMFGRAYLERDHDMRTALGRAKACLYSDGTCGDSLYVPACAKEVALCLKGIAIPPRAHMSFDHFAGPDALDVWAPDAPQYFSPCEGVVWHLNASSLIPATGMVPVVLSWTSQRGEGSVFLTQNGVEGAMPIGSCDGVLETELKANTRVQLSTIVRSFGDGFVRPDTQVSHALHRGFKAQILGGLSSGVQDIGGSVVDGGSQLLSDGSGGTIDFGDGSPGADTAMDQACQADPTDGLCRAADGVAELGNRLAAIVELLVSFFDWFFMTGRGRNVWSHHLYRALGYPRNLWRPSWDGAGMGEKVAAVGLGAVALPFMVGGLVYLIIGYAKKAGSTGMAVS